MRLIAIFARGSSVLFNKAAVCRSVAFRRLLAAFALALVLSALRYSTAEVFSIFAVVTFLTALVVESLIGDDLRRIFGLQR